MRFPTVAHLVGWQSRHRLGRTGAGTGWCCRIPRRPDGRGEQALFQGAGSQGPSGFARSKEQLRHVRQRKLSRSPSRVLMGRRFHALQRRGARVGPPSAGWCAHEAGRQSDRTVDVPPGTAEAARQRRRRAAEAAEAADVVPELVAQVAMVETQAASLPRAAGSTRVDGSNSLALSSLAPHSRTASADAPPRGDLPRAIAACRPERLRDVDDLLLPRPFSSVSLQHRDMSTKMPRHSMMGELCCSSQSALARDDRQGRARMSPQSSSGIETGRSNSSRRRSTTRRQLLALPHDWALRPRASASLPPQSLAGGSIDMGDFEDEAVMPAVTAFFSTSRVTCDARLRACAGAPAVPDRHLGVLVAS